MKIALFIPTLDGGGAERVMVILSREFSSLGHDVDLVLASAVGPYLSQLPANVRTIDCKATRPITAIPALIKYLRKERPVAILSSLFQANLALLLAVKISRVPVRCVVREATLLSFDLRVSKNFSSKLIPTLIRICYPWADAVVSLSQGVADDLSATTGFPRELVRVVYNPIDIQEIQNNAEASLNHPWLKEKKKFTIIGIGRFCYEKDFPTLIRAFSIINQSIDANLIILGDGELRASMERLIQELSLSDKVDLPGFEQNPHKYLARADLFVLSSRWEGLGNVLIEALASGVPIISTDCPCGPREVLQNGKYGRLVPVGNPQDLAFAILRVINAEKITFNKNEALNRFNKEKIAKTFLDLMLMGTE